MDRIRGLKWCHYRYNSSKWSWLKIKSWMKIWFTVNFTYSELYLLWRHGMSFSYPCIRSLHFSGGKMWENKIKYFCWKAQLLWTFWSFLGLSQTLSPLGCFWAFFDLFGSDWSSLNKLNFIFFELYFENFLDIIGVIPIWAPKLVSNSKIKPSWNFFFNLVNLISFRLLLRISEFFGT